MKQRMKRWLSGAMAAVLALTMLTTLPDVVTMPVTAAVTQQQRAADGLTVRRTGIDDAVDYHVVDIGIGRQ